MRYLKNETGHMTILMMWLLVLTSSLLILSVNFIKIYAVKERASISAEQASIVATDLLYEHTMKAIRDYDDDYWDALIANLVEGEILPEYDSVQEKIENEKISLQNRGYNEQKALRKAINKVLNNELSGSCTTIPVLGVENLQCYVEKEVREAEKDLSSEVAIFIEKNGGKANDFKVQMFDEKERIVVEGKATFETISDNKLIGSFKKDLPQVGKSSPIPFVQRLNWSDTVVEVGAEYAYPSFP